MSLRNNHWPLLMILVQLSKVISNIWKKINQQPNALVRITNFTSPFQRSSFIKSYLSYYLFISMFPYEEGKKKIDIISENFPSLMINDHQSIMDKMLATYQQCIEGVLTERDKFLNGYSSNIIKFLICGRISTTSKSSMPL